MPSIAFQVFTKVITYAIIIFLIYFAYKYFISKKVGKISKIFAWVIAIFLLLCGALGLVFSFAALSIFYQTGEPRTLVGGIFFTLFSLAFIFVGIFLILGAKEKLKRPKLFEKYEQVQKKAKLKISNFEGFEGIKRNHAKMWWVILIILLINSFLIGPLVRFLVSDSLKISFGLSSLFLGIYFIIYGNFSIKYKMIGFFNWFPLVQGRKARNWGIFYILLGVVLILVGILIFIL